MCFISFIGNHLPLVLQWCCWEFNKKKFKSSSKQCNFISGAAGNLIKKNKKFIQTMQFYQWCCWEFNKKKIKSSSKQCNFISGAAGNLIKKK